MKYFSGLIYFFISIGSNTERRKSQVDYGNMGVIVYYLIQLLGQVFSQFESKSIVFFENDYLAKIGQYSSIPFTMIVIHYDPITKNYVLLYFWGNIFHLCNNNFVNYIQTTINKQFCQQIYKILFQELLMVLLNTIS
ncbi:unnamed protein product [Paramecium primaurelia]|uniref:Uncharacterized protein n=1 Tax=Paramecium primaurelia TaxID=5886 RepID=A0A8S1QM07_PARPR|nr:unnamed protein product [Paramecium primaurelia]